MAAAGLCEGDYGSEPLYFTGSHKAFTKSLHPLGQSCIMKKDAELKEYTVYDFSQVSDPSREENLAFFFSSQETKLLKLWDLFPVVRFCLMRMTVALRHSGAYWLG